MEGGENWSAKWISDSRLAGRKPNPYLVKPHRSILVPSCGERLGAAWRWGAKGRASWMEEGSLQIVLEKMSCRHILADKVKGNSEGIIFCLRVEIYTVHELSGWLSRKGRFCLWIFVAPDSWLKLSPFTFEWHRGWCKLASDPPFVLSLFTLEFFSLPSSAINNLLILMPCVRAAKQEFKRFTAPLTFHLGILRWFFRWKIIFFVLSFGQR